MDGGTVGPCSLSMGIKISTLGHMLIPKRYALKPHTHILAHTHKQQTRVLERARAECIDQGHRYLIAKATGAPQSHQERWARERWKPVIRSKDGEDKRKGM